jgi:hypothetical protein
MKHFNSAKHTFVTIVLILGSMSAVSAQAVEFKGVVGFGMDFGGDVLDSGMYTDGTTWDVRANKGLALNIGMVMVTGSFETQATVGYKFGGPEAKNGSVTFDVVPVELMEFYRTSNIRMGLGMVYHSSPELVKNAPIGSGSLANGTYKFDNAVGSVVQIGWAPEKLPFSIDLRHTTVNFKQSGVTNAKSINGNVTGLYMSFFF